MSNLDQAEIIRTYIRAGIVIFFLSCFGYVLHNYVGTDTQTVLLDGSVVTEKGKIQPSVVYSWLTGLIMGFMAFYFTEDFKKLMGK
ncbi:hypothetical protein LCGC14_1662680 [marine sediment metagenome]|uniref:Uncharacterized protein n=1 Tax=marine sediment metagenome TaxID=412755 RepID=A0A0F9KTP6_9ZZZZ